MISTESEVLFLLVGVLVVCFAFAVWAQGDRNE